jgi:hypothetical protein
MSRSLRVESRGPTILRALSRTNGGRRRQTGQLTSRCSAEPGTPSHDDHSQHVRATTLVAAITAATILIATTARDGLRSRGENRQPHLHYTTRDGEGRHDRDLDQRGRHPAYRCLEHQDLQVQSARHRHKFPFSATSELFGKSLAFAPSSAFIREISYNRRNTRRDGGFDGKRIMLRQRKLRAGERG